MAKVELEIGDVDVREEVIERVAADIKADIKKTVADMVTKRVFEVSADEIRHLIVDVFDHPVQATNNYGEPIPGKLTKTFREHLIDEVQKQLLARVDSDGRLSSYGSDKMALRDWLAHKTAETWLKTHFLAELQASVKDVEARIATQVAEAALAAVQKAAAVKK